MAVNHPNLAAAAAAAVMMVVMATAGAAVIAPMLPATGPRTYCYCRRDCQRYDGVRGGAAMDSGGTLHIRSRMWIVRPCEAPNPMSRWTTCM